MKRRDFLKQLAVTTGGLAWQPLPVEALFKRTAQDQESPPPPAFAIRGLVEQSGQFLQPIRLMLPQGPPDSVAKIRVDGMERGQVAPPNGPFDVLIPAVDSEQSVHVEVEIAGSSKSYSVVVKPVRKVTIYVLAHSHNDIGYTDLQANVEEKQINNLALGIDLARRTADYPEGARFVWNMEGLWAADMFLRRASDEQRAEFFTSVQKGWVALNGMYANELTGLCRPEELLQLFRYATRLADQCKVPIDSAMISDVPGFTWGTATAMAQAGIRYFSAAPNFFDRIGSLMEVWQDKPFWWLSPSGREKLLVWIPWTGYAMSHVVKQATDQWVSDYQDRLDKVNFPYDISYIRWSGHGDNAAPDPQISEFFKEWNTKYAWPKFVISSTSTAFRAFEQRHGAELPQFKGDLTPYWEDGAGSSALETAINRNTAERLVQAETLFAIRTSDPKLTPVSEYPTEAFTDAWRNVLLYSEHTWGAWNSVSDSENPFVKSQWDTKRSFAIQAARQSRDLLDKASEPYNPYNWRGGIKPIDVWNATSWSRSGLAVFQGAESPLDCVTDQNGKPVSSQRLSPDQLMSSNPDLPQSEAQGQLAVWIDDVPPFSARRVQMSPKPPHPPEHVVSSDGTTLDNGIIRVRVDAKTGDIIELRDLRHNNDNYNYTDTAGSERINQYLYLAGANLADLQTSGPATITTEANGPLVVILKIESDAPGCHSLVRKIQLCAGSDYVELVNIVDKKRAPMNPTPSKGDWAQHGGKESVQFAFPFNLPNGQIHMDVPLAVMRPEIDQLPGSCKNWLPVGRWIDVSNENRGVTWATLDAPLVEIGEISARMLGSQTKPDIWRKHIEPTQKFYSWVMNNHWGTNYRAYQEGVVTFRYALRPHGAYDPVAAARFATGLAQPLIAVPAKPDSPLPHSFPLLVEPADVLVATLKPSDDGKAWIVRLFGASGRDLNAKLIWPYGQPESLWLSDTSEKPLDHITGAVPVPGWGLVTLRAERSKNPD